jgi:hypothetical protein
MAVADKDSLLVHRKFRFEYLSLPRLKSTESVIAWGRF